MGKKSFTVNVTVSSEKDENVFEDFSVEVQTTGPATGLKRLVWDALHEGLHKLHKEKKIVNFGPWVD